MCTSFPLNFLSATTLNHAPFIDQRCASHRGRYTHERADYTGLAITNTVRSVLSARFTESVAERRTAGSTLGILVMAAHSDANLGALPVELITEIAEYVGVKELIALRLVCNHVSASCIEPYAKRIMRNREHLYTCHSLRALVDMTSNPLFAKHVESIVILSVTLAHCHRESTLVQRARERDVHFRTPKIIIDNGDAKPTADTIVAGGEPRLGGAGSSEEVQDQNLMFLGWENDGSTASDDTDVVDEDEKNSAMEEWRRATTREAAELHHLETAGLAHDLITQVCANLPSVNVRPRLRICPYDEELYHPTGLTNYLLQLGGIVQVKHFTQNVSPALVSVTRTVIAAIEYAALPVRALQVSAHWVEWTEDNRSSREGYTRRQGPALRINSLGFDFSLSRFAIQDENSCVLLANLFQGVLARVNGLDSFVGLCVDDTELEAMGEALKLHTLKSVEYYHFDTAIATLDEHLEPLVGTLTRLIMREGTIHYHGGIRYWPEVKLSHLSTLSLVTVEAYSETFLHLLSHARNLANLEMRHLCLLNIDCLGGYVSILNFLTTIDNLEKVILQELGTEFGTPKLAWDKPDGRIVEAELQGVEEVCRQLEHIANHCYILDEDSEDDSEDG